MGRNRHRVQARGHPLTYAVSIESFEASYAELEPLYRRHYAEMCDRLESEGVEVSPYNPRLDEYARSSREGWLLTIVLRAAGSAVGYSNIYVTNDMHNGDKIAQEDTIYVAPEHRNGSGRLLARAVHQELKMRGVKRLNVTTATDLRVSKWLARQGYKHTAHCMTLAL